MKLDDRIRELGKQSKTISARELERKGLLEMGYSFSKNVGIVSSSPSRYIESFQIE